MKIIYTIARLMKDYDISLRELSKRSGVHVDSLCQIESRNAPGVIHDYIGIAKVFEMRLSQFFVECEKDLDAGYPEAKI